MSRFLLPILAGVIALTNLGGATPVIAEAESSSSEETCIADANGECWQMSEDEEQRWDEDIIGQYFEQTFAGIELTPEQQRFAQAENARYYYKFKELGDRVEAEGREIWTEAEAQELENEFLQRLESGLTQEQIQQVKANWEPEE